MRARHSRAFTLIELLVVMAVIAILLGITAASLRSSDAPALQRALADSSALFDLARSTARKDSAPVRVLVHDDPAAPDAYRTSLALATRPAPDGPWQLASAPLKLPPGIVVILDHPSSPQDSLQLDWSGTPTSCRYFELDGNGTLNSDPASLVIASATIESGQVSLRQPGPLPGLRITASGRPMSFDDADSLP
jgi:prepilin-type N-terminal cleavage/methylation domain-containing protein